MFPPEFHAYFMRLALREAAKAAEAEEVPAGCVVIRKPASSDMPLAAVKVLARAHNQTEMLKDATAHAEMIALTQASAALGDWRLTDTILYVTKEPCAMCAGAMVNCRLGKLVFACPDTRMGAAGGAIDITAFPGMLHHVEVTAGLLKEEAQDMLQNFFRTRRLEQKERPKDAQIDQ